MKIICACLNSKYIHSSLAPWCLKAGIETFCDHRITVKVMESTINADIFNFADKIVSEEPQIISFSCYIWNRELTLLLAEDIRKKCNCKIVLGGPEAAFCSEDILNKYPFIDYVSSGEGEWSFSSLINSIYIGSDLYSVEGLSFRDKDNNIIINPVCEHNETPPSPYCNEYFELISGRIAYIESSRGCPYRCAYCLSGSVGKLKLFDIEQIKQDITSLASCGAKTIKFIDRTFNASSSHANEILRFIYDNYKETKIRFHFEISGDIIKEDTFKLLEIMPKGLIQLEIGIQSFNERTLIHINRKTNLNKLTDNINRLIKLGTIHIHTDLIAGLSFEDLDSFINSFNKAFALRSDMLQLGFLKLLHGSDMKDYRHRYPAVYCDKPPYEIIRNPWLSESDLEEIKYCEVALDKLYNSGRFLITIDYLLKETNFSPFELFRMFGKMHNLSCIPLKELAEKIYTYYSDYCEETILREKICCDLVSVTANIKLPDILISYNPSYKRYKKYFSELFKSNVRIVILNSTNRIYVVSQESPKDTKNRYQGYYYNIDDITIK